MLLTNTKVQQHVKPENSSEQIDPPTELRLYVGASIPKDTNKNSQTPCRFK